MTTMMIQEISSDFILAGLFPHGVFKIPILTIAEATSFSFATALILAVINMERRKQFLPNLKIKNIWLYLSAYSW